MIKKKTMWDVIQNRVDNNPDLRRAYGKFIIDKSKLIAIERKEDSDNGNR